MQIETVSAPPPGFRKTIPLLVKLEVVLAQDGCCTSCKQRLGELTGLEFDHVPALQLRIWCEETKDTIPPANSAKHIEAKHADCHAAKTFGSKATGRGSDITEIARVKRLTRKEQEFRQRLLTKSDGVEEPERKKKYRWPKRKFRSGAPDGQTDAGDQAGSNPCDE